MAHTSHFKTNKAFNYILLLLSTLLYACNAPDCTNGMQDGNETGIDCGGDCPSCTNSGGGTSPNNSLYNTWYLLNSRPSNYSAVTGEESAIVYTSSSCKLQLTNQTLSGSQLVAFGLPNNCSFPSQIPWNYNASNNLMEIAGDQYSIESVSSDSLILEKMPLNYSWKHYYSSLENSYSSQQPQVKLEFITTTSLPANTIKLENDTLPAGQFYWSKVLTGSGSQAIFQFNCSQLFPSPLSLDTPVTYECRITDMSGRVLFSTGMLTSYLYGNGNGGYQQSPFLGSDMQLLWGQ